MSSSAPARRAAFWPTRLSRDGRHRVLLLEAGGSDARLWIKVPIGYAFNVSNPGSTGGMPHNPMPVWAGAAPPGRADG